MIFIVQALAYIFYGFLTIGFACVGIVSFVTVVKFTVDQAEKDRYWPCVLGALLVLYGIGWLVSH